MAYLEGNTVRVTVGATLIGGQQGCSINRGTNTSDTTTKDSGVWEDAEATGLNWSIDCDGLVVVDDEAIDALITAWKSMQKVTVKYGTPTKFEEGQAIIESLSQNAPQKEKCTYSVTLKGCGELQSKTGSAN